MCRIISFIFSFLFSTILFAENWQAKWISPLFNQNQVNTWLGFKKEVTIDQVPVKAMAKIAVDSKYWLWVNGEIVVREGGIKRGPTPKDTYYDIVDIAPFLKSGRNQIGVLVWFFGKDGFSHKSSGKGALLFDFQTSEVNILSDASWQSGIMHAYQTAGAPYPNFRLSESSICYDARLENANWYYDPNIRLGESLELANAGDYPWNKLYPRPIPFWKESGLLEYEDKKIIGTGNSVEDTIECKLPYNAQITPYLKVEGEAGKKIIMFTDNYARSEHGVCNIRAEYITKNGMQEYENPGWTNGHKMFYIIPKGLKVIELKYRETGYNAEFDGKFTSSDPFLNKYWQKAVRTLYVNMRDTYMDCPERERAQWTGDAVNEAEQAYYALSPSANLLTRKWLHEVINW